MAWFGRGRDDDTRDRHDDARSRGDSPRELRERLRAQVRFINSRAGRLPVAAVVGAREVTDLVAEVIDSAGDGELDIYAVVQINGIVDDYLPTTLQAFLNLDPSVVDRPLASGRTPTAALAEQLDALHTAAEDLLQASRAHDVDALTSQGNFLRAKFTRSDLDL